MPLDLGTIEPPQLGQATRFDIPINEWMGVQFRSGQASQLGPRLTGWLDELNDTSPLLQPQEANDQFGVKDHLTFTAPVRSERAREMRNRKLAELEYSAYHEVASHSWLSPKAALGTLAALVGGSTHPVDFAVNFLPFVGEEAKAVQLAKSGAGAFRQRLARGLITAETIGETPLLRLLPNYSRAVIDATLGNAAIEIPNFYLARRDQAEYDENDFLFNVFGGGLAGGTIAHGLKRFFQIAHYGYERLQSDTKERTFQDTMSERISGEARDIRERAAVDRQAIRDELRFNEEAERANIVEAVKKEFGDPEAKPEPVSPLIAAIKEAESAIESIREPIIGDAVSLQDEIIKQIAEKHGINRGDLNDELEARSTSKSLNRERMVSDLKVEGVEMKAGATDEQVKQAHSTIFDQTKPATGEQMDAHVQTAMQRRVENLLAERRADAQRMLDGKLTAVDVREHEQNVQLAKMMTDEQVKKYAATLTPEEQIKWSEADTKAKLEDAADVEKEVEQMASDAEKEAAELKEAGKTDEASAKLQESEMLRKDLEDSKADVPVDNTKAIEAARDCIVNL